jgi:hypothetical protein
MANVKSDITQTLQTFHMHPNYPLFTAFRGRVLRRVGTSVASGGVVRATLDLLDRVEVEADASSSPASLFLVLRFLRVGPCVASGGVVRATPDLLDLVEVEADASSSTSRLFLALRVVRVRNLRCFGEGLCEQHQTF